MNNELDKRLCEDDDGKVPHAGGLLPNGDVVDLTVNELAAAHAVVGCITTLAALQISGMRVDSKERVICAILGMLQKIDNAEHIGCPYSQIYEGLCIYRNGATFAFKDGELYLTSSFQSMLDDVFDRKYGDVPDETPPTPTPPPAPSDGGGILKEVLRDQA